MSTDEMSEEELMGVSVQLDSLKGAAAPSAKVWMGVSRGQVTVSACEAECFGEHEFTITPAQALELSERIRLTALHRQDQEVGEGGEREVIVTWVAEEVPFDPDAGFVSVDWSMRAFDDEVIGGWKENPPAAAACVAVRLHDPRESALVDALADASALAGAWGDGRIGIDEVKQALPRHGEIWVP